MRNKFLVFIVMIIAVFTGCQPDEENAPADSSAPTVAESQQFLNDKMNSIVNCFESLNSGNAMQSFYQFTGLSDGVANSNLWMQMLEDRASDIVDFNQIIQNNNIELGQLYGRFDWNGASQTWIHTPGSDSVVINFPSASNVSINDSHFVLTGYSDELHYVNNEPVYLPTETEMNLTINNELVFRMSFNGSYNASGFPTPINLSTTLFISPFNYSFSLSQVSPTHFVVNGSLMSGGGCQQNVALDLNFINNDFEQFELDEDLASMSGIVSFGDLRINGSWDANYFYSMNNPSANQINNTLNLEVFNQDVKIADLGYVDINGGKVLMVYFSDSSSQEASEYYTPAVNSILNMLEPYFGSL
jgi:hypothetical protein